MSSYCLRRIKSVISFGGIPISLEFRHYEVFAIQVLCNNLLFQQWIINLFRIILFIFVRSCLSVSLCSYFFPANLLFMDTVHSPEQLLFLPWKLDTRSKIQSTYLHLWLSSGAKIWILRSFFCCLSKMKIRYFVLHRHGGTSLAWLCYVTTTSTGPLCRHFDQKKHT